MEQGQFLLMRPRHLTVGAGFYYYLKVVRAMYWKEAADSTPIRTAPLTSGAIAVLVFCIFLFGVYPAPIIRAWGPPPSENPRLVTR